MHGLSCSPWDLPRSGFKPVSLALAGGFFTTLPSRKPGHIKLKGILKNSTVLSFFLLKKTVFSLFCGSVTWARIQLSLFLLHWVSVEFTHILCLNWDSQDSWASLSKWSHSSKIARLRATRQLWKLGFELEQCDNASPKANPDSVSWEINSPS